MISRYTNVCQYYRRIKLISIGVSFSWYQLFPLLVRLVNVYNLIMLKGASLDMRTRNAFQHEEVFVQFIREQKSVLFARV